MEIVKFEELENKILELQNKKVLVDRDVAELYGVETKRVNEAVKNNPLRFPDGYIIELTKKEKKELVENFDRFNKLKHSTSNPKAFTEKGLYMLANTLKQLPKAQMKEQQQKLMQKSGEIIADILDDSLETDESETTIELNLAVLKFKHTLKKKKNSKEEESK